MREQHDTGLAKHPHTKLWEPAPHTRRVTGNLCMLAEQVIACGVGGDDREVPSNAALRRELPVLIEHLPEHLDVIAALLQDAHPEVSTTVVLGRVEPLTDEKRRRKRPRLHHIPVTHPLPGRWCWQAWPRRDEWQMISESTAARHCDDNLQGFIGGMWHEHMLSSSSPPSPGQWGARACLQRMGRSPTLHQLVCATGDGPWDDDDDGPLTWSHDVLRGMPVVLWDEIGVR